MEEQKATEQAPRIKVLANGSKYDLDKGRIISAPTRGQITKENTHEFTRKRREKTARLLRQAIVTETGDLLQVPTRGPAASVAAAGGILWREIVLNPDAYPRDRMEAWEKLGRHAGILADPREPAQNDPVQGATELLQAGAKLLELLRETIQPTNVHLHDTIDANVSDG